jgi:hypothetical protein
MGKDWMDELFNGRHSRAQEDKEKRRQEQIRHSERVALWKPIWDDIERQLEECIRAFNRRATPESQVCTISHTGEFCLHLKCEKVKEPFVISLDPTTGILSFGIREKALKKQKVPIEAIDEEILRDYLTRLV